MDNSPASTEKLSSGRERSLLNLRQGRPQQFKPGQSGNPAGRPLGSRSIITERFLKALAKDFATHGMAAIRQCRTKDPSTYVRVIAGLLPAKVDLDMNMKSEQRSLEQVQADIQQAIERRAQELYEQRMTVQTVPAETVPGGMSGSGELSAE